MRRRADLWMRAILAVLCTYAVLGGATANAGMLVPRYQAVGLALIGVGGAAWLLVRGRARWHATPLDGVIALWAGVLGFSLLLNLDLWRRIAIGLWYVGLYVLIWYVAQDLTARRVLRLPVLADGLLLGGAVVMVFGLGQLVSLLSAFWGIPAAARAGLPPFSDLVRLTATLENPNRLATLMVAVLPLALARALAAQHRLWRAAWLLYAALAAVHVFFTFARGGWLSAGVALGAFALLLAAQHGLLSPARLRAWWAGQPRASKAGMRVGAAAALALVVGAVSLFVLLFARVSATGTRAADQRGTFYEVAAALFAERPISGYGLFTYGRGLVRLDSMPPRQVHSHAHSIPFTVAAELGIPGLVALAASAVVIGRAAWRSWRATSGAPSERLALIGALAGLAGFAFHHLVDFTALTALLALVGLTLVMLVVSGVGGEFRRRGSIVPPLLVALWAALLISGLVSSSANGHYFEAVAYSASHDDPAGAAQRLQAAIDADPAMPVYSLVQGYFLGVAAHQQAAARQPLDAAVEAYRRFIGMEPYYAPAWANLGALYWQRGEREPAIAALRRASEIAPESWQMAYNLGVYLEAQGDEAGARSAYERALRSRPESRLYAGWRESELRRTMAQRFSPAQPESPMMQALVALEQGQPAQALRLWGQAPPEVHSSVTGRALSVIFAVEVVQAGGTEGAEGLEQVERLQAELQQQQATTGDFLRARGRPDDADWMRLGQAYAAWLRRDEAAARRELAQARALMPLDPPDLPDIIASQFLRVGISQYLLPQLYAPAPGPEFMYLLARLEQRLP